MLKKSNAKVTKVPTKLSQGTNSGVKTRAPKANPNVIVIPTIKPRNHIALAAQSRVGGAHTKSASAVRRAQELAVKKLLDDL